MKKSELEDQHSAYTALISTARTAEADGMMREALAAALAAFPFIDGMMQYERKYYEKDSVAVAAIDCAMNCAPLLLDFRSIDKLDSLLSDFKRISKNASEDLPARVNKARELMWTNHRLWSHLERNPGTPLSELSKVIGATDKYCQQVAKLWARMGLIKLGTQQGATRVSLATRMGEVVTAKCSACGQKAEAPKAMFLEPLACSECNKSCLFVILAS